MFGRRILAAAALVAAASAQQLTITNPGPNMWWVASSINTLAWNCQTAPSSVTNFNVVLSNSDPSIHITDLALVANVPVYDCSFTVNQQQSALIVSNSWTLSLTSPTNITDVYASTQFSVEAAGSTYPASTAAASGTSTSTSTAGSSSSTSSSKQNGAVANYIPAGMGMAAAIALGFVVA